MLRGKLDLKDCNVTLSAYNLFSKFPNYIWDWNARLNWKGHDSGYRDVKAVGFYFLIFQSQFCFIVISFFIQLQPV